MDLIIRKAAQGRITEMIECVTNGDDGYYDEEVDIGFFCACGERSENGNHH